MRFRVTARQTRGGWRAVVLAHNGAVAFKTMPVFREKGDAERAARAWLKEHGAHADSSLRVRGKTYHQALHGVPRGEKKTRRFLKRRAGRAGRRVSRALTREQVYAGAMATTPTPTTSPTTSTPAPAQASRRIPYRERKFIPKRMYALPERAPGKGALPLADPRRPHVYDPKHVRNAAARLSMMRNMGHVTPAEYRRAEKRIIHAACAVGVERTCRRHLAAGTRMSRVSRASTREYRMAAYSRRSR